MKSKSLKELVTEAINALRECAIIHTKMVTWDSISGDGWAGYINTSTIGVSDPTKYHWFISTQPSWTQHNQIQDVTANGFTMRCWYMASPSDGKVILLRNTKPTAFRIIGIRKLGGVIRKVLSSTSPFRRVVMV